MQVVCLGIGNYYFVIEFNEKYICQTRLVNTPPKNSFKNLPLFIKSLIGDLKKYFTGYNISFEKYLKYLDFKGFDDFSLKVFRGLIATPYGKIISYKDLSVIIGEDGQWRKVAKVLSTNPFPLIVPCHRVICSNGDIGGYTQTEGGKTLQNVSLKKLLLSIEGVIFQERGNIVL